MITPLINVWGSRRPQDFSIDVNIWVSKLLRSTKLCRQSPTSGVENSNSFVQLISGFFSIRSKHDIIMEQPAIKYVWLDIEKLLPLIITIIKNFLALYTLELLPIAATSSTTRFQFYSEVKIDDISEAFEMIRHRNDLITVENNTTNPFDADLSWPPDINLGARNLFVFAALLLPFHVNYGTPFEVSENI